MLGPRPSGPTLTVRFLLTGQRWAVPRRGDIDIHGLTPRLRPLGLA